VAAGSKRRADDAGAEVGGGGVSAARMDRLRAASAAAPAPTRPLRWASAGLLDVDLWAVCRCACSRGGCMNLPALPSLPHKTSHTHAHAGTPPASLRPTRTRSSAALLEALQVSAKGR